MRQPAAHALTEHTSNPAAGNHMLARALRQCVTFHQCITLHGALPGDCLPVEMGPLSDSRHACSGPAIEGPQNQRLAFDGEDQNKGSPWAMTPCMSTGLWFAHPTRGAAIFLDSVIKYLWLQPEEWDQAAVQEVTWISCLWQSRDVAHLGKHVQTTCVCWPDWCLAWQQVSQGFIGLTLSSASACIFWCLCQSINSQCCRTFSQEQSG